MTRQKLLSGRLRAVLLIGFGCAALTLSACTPAPPESSQEDKSTSTSATPDDNQVGDPAEVAAIRAAVVQTMSENHVRAAIVRVMRGDEVVLTEAWGESMAGVPASVDMHFRNGAVAIPQVAAVLLQLVDEGVVSLDDPIAQWLPEVPHADDVTLDQLARMTSGYADYVQNDAFIEAFFDDPFRQWEPEELYEFGTSRPLWFDPGTNWAYAHTNYVLLGLALEQITGEPLDAEIQRRVLEPLGMTQTAAPGTPAIAEPVLHSFDSERRSHLEIPAGVPFMEDATFWNPSWTLGRGSIQYSNIADTATVIRAIGRGDLVSQESHALQISPELRGQTSVPDGCDSCHEMDDYFTFGYGVVLSGDWIMQTPTFAGLGGAAAYLPAADITIAVAATYDEAAFDADGAPAPNLAGPLYAAIAGIVAPEASTLWGVPQP